MTIYEIGRRYSEWDGLPDGVTSTVSNDGLTLLIHMDRPTVDEEWTISRPNRIEVRFTPVSDAVGFWTVRFGDGHWMDAPWSPGILETPLSPPDVGGGEGWSMHVMLVDTHAGRLRYQRMVGLGTDLTRSVTEWAKNCPSIDRSEYEAIISRTSAAYTSAQLANMAPSHSRWDSQTSQ